MRLRVFKCRCRYTILIAFANIVLICLLWKLLYPWNETAIAPITVTHAPQPSKAPNRHITKMITIILRQFENFENDVAPTLQSILTLLPNIQIVVVSDIPPYPPFEFTVPNATLKNVKVVNLEVNLLSNAKDSDPLTFIKTKYVLFVPDSLRIASRQNIQHMLTYITKNPNENVAVPFSSTKFLNCQRLDLNLKEWSLKYEQIKSDSNCDAIVGKHAILLPTDILRTLPRPFLLPFPESLYLQMIAKKIKVHILPDISFSDGRALFRSQPSKQSLRIIETNRRISMYQAVGIKKIIRESGSIEWHGCTRDSERCFPPVVGAPSYLTIGRWTPPCCLAHLRRTLRHTVTALQQAGARCWLEGATLLGAVRKGDILPWSSHLEVGINEADVVRVQWLMRASNRGGAQDPQGFLWEKATQGDYYRVLFSKHNRLHVNILPFRQKNGTMAKDTWFVEHQSDFPDHFLHPMSSIELAGKQMPCPNNVRDFLEHKFGKGIIEQTKRPGSNLPYP